MGRRMLVWVGGVCWFWVRYFVLDMGSWYVWGLCSSMCDVWAVVVGR